MLTYSDARAPPTNPGPRINRVTINKLPEDVLLEVFDAYRQDMELLPRYETIWNCRDGWFKLTHVCQRWRRIVHLSPTRLHVHLLFTAHKSSRVFMLKRLPPFLALVDFRDKYWTEREERLALAALKCQSRHGVRGITLRRSYGQMVKLLKALSHSFPELESLNLRLLSSKNSELLILPSTFLSGSAPCLRRLTLKKVAPKCLSPLLSFSTGLVELTLSLRTERGLPPEASLLSNLQRMSCLRHLELKLLYQSDDTISKPPLPAATGDVVPLSKLTHLIFRGHRSYLQALVVGLAAPSLQHLDAVLLGSSLRRSHFPIPHLCNFIRGTGCHFTAVRFVFSRWKLKFYARTGSQSVDEQPFKLIIPEYVSLVQLGQELSESLSTVEELTIVRDEPLTKHDHFPSDLLGFFSHVPEVKMVRVPSKVAFRVARLFWKGGQEPAMDILPALEQVKVDMRDLPIIKGKLCASIPVAFEPLAAARQRVGRHIVVMGIYVDGGADMVTV